jgi:hypothetical protein
MTVPQPLPNTVNDDLAQQIALAAGRDLTPEQVNAVLAAWNNVNDGDKLGTVKRNPADGAVAHRVNLNGVHQWHVSTPSGEFYWDTQSVLPWPEIWAG